MQFSSSILATMLAIGFVQAQTPTCSNVPNPSPPVTMHCNVRGILDPALINITSSNVVSSVDACITLSKAYEPILAFSYNYSSLVCTQYGTNLHEMGLKQKKKLDPDTVYFNHNCYVQQCNSDIVSTSTGQGTTMTVTSAAPMTTTQATCDKNNDPCLSKFNTHPKTASSVCAGVQTQYFPPRGFGGACTQVWDTQVSSVCSCLFGAQLVPTTSFASNTSTAAPTSVPANTTSSSYSTTSSATGTGGSSTITDLPIFGNSTISLLPPQTTSNATTTASNSSIIISPTSFSTSSMNTTTTSSSSSTTSSSSLSVNVPIFTDPSGTGALPSNTNATSIIGPTGTGGSIASGTGGLLRRATDPAAPFAVGQQKRSFRLRRNKN